MEFKINIALTFDQPILKPNWASEITSLLLHNFSNLLFNTVVNNYEKQLTRVIPHNL